MTRADVAVVLSGYKRENEPSGRYTHMLNKI
jgi:hypothetical protein